MHAGIDNQQKEPWNPKPDYGTKKVLKLVTLLTKLMHEHQKS